MGETKLDTSAALASYLRQKDPFQDRPKGHEESMSSDQDTESGN